MSELKRYHIEFDIRRSEQHEEWPTKDEVAGAISEGLPKEFFDDTGDDWEIAALRSSEGTVLLHTANTELRNQLSAYRAELAGLENALADSDERADRLEASNNELIAAKVQVTTTYQSVGVTDEEVEALVDVLDTGLRDIQYASLEDASADVDKMMGALDTIVRDNLPVMDERDLGWGDDDDLQILEHQVETALGALRGIETKLDFIRTER